MGVNRNVVAKLLNQANKSYVYKGNVVQLFHVFDTLQRAFESLMFESFTNFILTVGCITVIVIWGLKYLILMLGQPQGTFVLLEVLSPDSLVHYFQSIHNNDISVFTGITTHPYPPLLTKAKRCVVNQV